jgi:5'-nucleotidase
MDPVAVSEKMVRFLRKDKNCDLVICLSHLGITAYKTDIGDVELAEQVSGIDVIIGGHSHTFLDGGLNVVSKDGWNTLITQVGFAGVWLGHIVVDFDNISGKKKIFAGKYKV